MGPDNKKTSLRSKIFFSFLLALLPVLLCIVGAIEILIVPSMSNTAKQELTNSTRLLKNAVETGATVAVRNRLKAIAEKNREIVRYHLSLAKQGNLTRKEAIGRARSILLSQQIGSSGYIYCIDSEGTAVVHPNPEVENTDNTRFPFVREQMGRKEGYIEYEWQNPGEDSPRPKALYMVYLPSLDWILSVSSYKAEFNELVDVGDFRDMVLSLRFGKSGYAYVINQQGDTLIHPILQEFNAFNQSDLSSNFVRTMIAKGSGSIEYEWRNPDEQATRTKLAVFESIPAYDWIIVSSSYLDEINQPARVAQKIAYFSMLLFLVAAALASYFLSGRLTKPVKAMIARLDENARNMKHDPLPRTTNDELGRLASEFNSFLKTIENKNRELSQEKERYRSLFETSPDAVFLLNGINVIDCNSSTIDIFGGDKATLLNSTVAELSPLKQPGGRDSSVMVNEIRERAKIEELQTFEWLHRRVGGELFNAEVRLKTFGEEGGEPLLVAFVRDITDRKEAEDALRQSEKKYRELIENAGDAIFIAQAGEIVFCNSKTAHLTGYSKDELSYAPFDHLIHPDDRAQILERHRRRLAGEEALPDNYSFTLLTKGGQRRTVQLSTVVIEWNNLPATLNFVRDITEQRKLESALQQAQKMQAIGTLAGGIAHDFNNILMGIQGRIDLIQADDQPSPVVFKHLQVMAEHVKSAADLTGQLLGVARGGKYQPMPTDLNELVRHSVDLFGRTKKEIEITTDFAKALVVGDVDSHQLEQVLLNIYVNAWQAMPQGGKLHLATSVVQLDEADCRPYGKVPGNYAKISVTDTGVGIDKTIQQRIFDPFFTTKKQGRGTGLGLASAYGIIQNHQGFITLSSNLGEGTTFNIFLPISEKRPQKSSSVEKELQQGSETILLIDDEEMILNVGRKMLENLGYRVIIADSGEEGLKYLQEDRGDIQLVILDLIMPGMEGEETFEKINTVDPALPVIISSGYAIDGKAERIMQKGGRAFIQKPFRLADISQLLRDVLTSKEEKNTP